MVTKRWLTIGLLVMGVLTGCGNVELPDLYTWQGWCYTVLMTDVPFAQLSIGDGYRDSFGLHSQDGLLNAVYTHNTTVNAEYVIAVIDVDVPNNTSRQVIATFNAFGVNQSVDTTVNDDLSFYTVVAQANGGTGNNQATVTLVTNADTNVTLQSLTVMGTGANPFPLDDCTADATPTPSPLPTSTNNPTATYVPTNTPNPTATPIPSSYVAWCHRSEFITGADGWNAIDSSATWTSAGWNTLGDGYSDSLFIIKQLPAKSIITGATMITDQSLYNGGRFYFQASISQFNLFDSYNIGSSGTQWDLRSIYEENINYVGIGLDSQIGSILEWNGNLIVAELHGLGVSNPFGADNCASLGTPTPVPTATQDCGSFECPTTIPIVTVTPNPSVSPTAVTATVTTTPSRTPTLTATSITPSPNPSVTATQIVTVTPNPTITIAPYTPPPAYTPNPSSIDDFYDNAGLFDNWNWGEAWNDMMQAVGNSINNGREWAQYGSDMANGIGNGWSNATPTGLVGLDDCEADRLIQNRNSNYCATIYLIDNTILAGTLGSVIVFAMTTYIDMLIMFQIIGYAQTVIAWWEEITST